MPTYVALLRGINLGGNRLSMKDLAAAMEELGCARVRTYIQSGNVVFDAPASVARSLAQKLEEDIQRRWKLKVPIVLRTAAELAKVAKDNPFLKAGAAPGECHVMFLADRPPAKDVAALDPERSPGDAFQVLGREIYLRLPNGMARTKLTNAYFDSKLRTVSTARNWRTVLKLLEMTGEG